MMIEIMMIMMMISPQLPLAGDNDDAAKTNIVKDILDRCITVMVVVVMMMIIITILDR